MAFHGGSTWARSPPRAIHMRYGSFLQSMPKNSAYSKTSSSMHQQTLICCAHRRQQCKRQANTRRANHLLTQMPCA
eukprot:5680495-Amphidinium_carterae.1